MVETMELADVDSHALLHATKRAPTDPHHNAEHSDQKDRAFAWLFFVNVGVVGVIALLLGVPNASHMYFTIHAEGVSASMSHGVRIFLTFIVISATGAMVSALWLQVLRHYAAQVMAYSLLASGLLLLCLSVAAFLSSSSSGHAVGFINLAAGIAVLLYARRMRASIAFASSNLAMASRVLLEFPNLLWTTYMVLAAQLIWTLVWSIAVLGVLAKSVDHLHDSTSLGNVCFVVMLLSLFWFVQVARNVLHCVTAGAVSDWWFGSHDAETVSRSQTRALTSSFGSICFGSLVLAVLSTLETCLLSARRRKGSRSANACLECLVRFVRRNVKYFNKFAFCHVAIYGKDFQTAGQDTLRLFRDRGWTVFLNDNLVSIVLSVGCFVVGATSGLLGSSWTHMALRCSPDEALHNPEHCETFNIVILTFIACFLIGFAMCAIASSILESVVATIVVLFAEDPSAFARAHPEEHTQIVDAWSRLKPDLLAVPAHGRVHV